MGIVWNIFFMFGGVAAMMLGMKIMGASLEKIAGSNMKKLLGKVTNNRLAGVGVGVAVTSIVQSSTATTVMLVGFVNVGIMTLAQATNVIMGANIGTTVTAHIVSLSGIEGGVDVGAIAAMVGCVGIMISMLVKNEKAVNIGNVLAGLGMIFVGLEFISTYAKEIMFVGGNKDLPQPFVQNIFQKDHFPLVLVLIGVVITALVHSSSTITSLMVVLASIGVLPFKNAIFLALGSNIGTCITSIMSSAGTHVNAKRTALMHLAFNFFGCLIFIVPVWILSDMVETLFAFIASDTGSQIAIFHTLFNLITTLILLPFSHLIVKLVCRLVPDKSVQTDEFKLKYIDERMTQVPAVAIDTIELEVVDMAKIARENIILSMQMLLDGVNNQKELEQNEKRINFLNKEITRYLTKLMSVEMTENEDKKVGSFYHVVSDVERVGDYCENIMEYSQKLKGQSEFSEQAKQELYGLKDKLIELLDKALVAFKQRDMAVLEQADLIEQEVDKITVELEGKHIERLKKNACTAQVGSVYLQTISNLERIGDHITNVAFSISPKSKH